MVSLGVQPIRYNLGLVDIVSVLFFFLDLNELNLPPKKKNNNKEEERKEMNERTNIAATTRRKTKHHCERTKVDK